MSYCKEFGKDKVIFATKEDHEKPSTVELPETERAPGLILPNGEINWNCPCLGGMATGPCGVEFREAFSCFHYRYDFEDYFHSTTFIFNYHRYANHINIFDVFTVKRNQKARIAMINFQRCRNVLVDIQQFIINPVVRTMMTTMRIRVWLIQGIYLLHKATLTPLINLKKQTKLQVLQMLNQRK